MKNFSLNQLAEGIRERHVGAERSRLMEKWSKTGLLRGLDGYRRESMAQLLENQAAQVLREANSLGQGGGSLSSSGQISGFTNIAFPMVRRVFGGLVSNELVSLQPMSLPSGLIFYLDYTYGSNVGGDESASASSASTYTKGQSLYNNPTGADVQFGSFATGGQYDLVGSGFTRLHKNSEVMAGAAADLGAWTGVAGAWVTGGTVAALSDVSGSNARWIEYDSQVETDVEAGLFDVAFWHVPVAAIQAAIPAADVLSPDQLAVYGFADNADAAEWGDKYQAGSGLFNLRRLNKRGDWNGSVFTPNPMQGSHIQVALRIAEGGAVPTMGTAEQKISVAVTDALTVDGGTGSVLTVPSFESDFGTDPAPPIPEINIKIEQISITAITRKLRARWSPELAQDLNAYHSLDAEVELTSILSEQVALEIDREILGDLVDQANGANFFWSRAPGRFVDKYTGRPIELTGALATGPQFTGTVREWYETLVETVIDVANTIHRKTLRGSANFMVAGPDVCTVLESSVLYKPKFNMDSEGQISSPFTIGAEAIGTVSNRFTVYKDPYFPRNKILVGYKGGSYLETGYVYAPYVPLIVTPTIFAPEDFTPRKGVMTRYGKKMVRSDFFGTVTLLDMNII